MSTTAANKNPFDATGEVFLADGGLETTLVFHQQLELPDFASFPLVETEYGWSTLIDYFRNYADVATRHGVGVVFETPTWRASGDWGRRLGYDSSQLAAINQASIALLQEIRAEYEPNGTPVVISGCLGPRGDGYVVGHLMSADEAEAYHRPQVAAFARAGADIVSFVTATYTDEAIGIIRAAREAGVPVVVSFTVETDGRLPSGQELRDAIEEVDATTDGYTTHFGLNCAHPDHFESTLAADDGWVSRIGLLRANASRMSHEELDNAEELDDGNPEELGASYAALRERFPTLRVLGGCCGTDHRHVAAIGEACLAPVAAGV